MKRNLRNTYICKECACYNETQINCLIAGDPWAFTEDEFNSKEIPRYCYMSYDDKLMRLQRKMEIATKLKNISQNNQANTKR